MTDPSAEDHTDDEPSDPATKRAKPKAGSMGGGANSGGGIGVNPKQLTDAGIDVLHCKMPEDWLKETGKTDLL